MERVISFNLQALFMAALLVTMSCFVDGNESRETIIWKAVATIKGSGKVKGTIFFTQEGKGQTIVNGSVSGLTPGRHGIHIHAYGDPKEDCIPGDAIGPHLNPAGKQHGAPQDENRHAGDLGNIYAGPDGIARFAIFDAQIPLSGINSIIGRAIDVHANPDDLGKGSGRLSKVNGNAGARIGCGFIWIQGY